jgi:hypothetical protein
MQHEDFTALRRRATEIIPRQPQTGPFASPLVHRDRKAKEWISARAEML